MAVTTQIAKKIECNEQARLRHHLAQAIRLLVKAHACHQTALMAGDSRLARFEDNLHTATVNWQLARQSYLEHRTAHGCGDRDLD